MNIAAVSREDAQRFEQCVVGGGVAVFPTDTVYGIGCDPENPAAVQRLYELKGRPAERPAAVMFFALEPALASLADLRAVERRVLQALLPGPVTLLLSNRAARFALACGPDPETLGLRVPRLPEHLRALSTLATPLLQSSANISGEPDARRLHEVPERLRKGVDLILDGGALPGRPSTVIDLRRYATERQWSVLREGALPASDVADLLAAAG